MISSVYEHLLCSQTRLIEFKIQLTIVGHSGDCLLLCAPIFLSVGRG